MAASGTWIALFSGGKDSIWALHCAREAGRDVEALVTATPRADSYLFHVPAVELTALQAEALGLPRYAFPVDEVEPDAVPDAGETGDRELAALERELRALVSAGELEPVGIITGAVASTFQRDRLAAMADRLNLEICAPLWNVAPRTTLQAMIDAGYDIRIVAVSAGGLDASWLGRRLDAVTVGELTDLAEDFGIHLMGEGGEYETIVVDGPPFERAISFDADVHWDGSRGWLEITDARLAAEPEPPTRRS